MTFTDGSGQFAAALITGIFALLAIGLTWLLSHRTGKTTVKTAVEEAFKDARAEYRELADRERAEDKAEIERLRAMHEHDQRTILRLATKGRPDD